jgi:hypothetical protein
MDLTLRERYWIKFCMKLITVLCLNNYYSQFYHPSYKLVQFYTLPLIRQTFRILNRINEFMDIRFL